MMAAKISRDPSIPLAGNSAGSSPRRPADARHHPQISPTRHPKRAVRLPAILSQDEVACLIDAALNPFHRVVLMTLYATGVRRAELTHLKISDIDSQRMVIHIRGGKGRKDRDLMLSPKLLEALREHWRGLRRKPAI